MSEYSPEQKKTLARYRKYYQYACRKVGSVFLILSALYVIFGITGGEVQKSGWGAVSLIAGACMISFLIIAMIKGRPWEKGDGK